MNAPLELDDEHRIVDLKYLTAEQHVPIDELKLSLVDVKCFDQAGRHYVVEMQVLIMTPTHDVPLAPTYPKKVQSYLLWER